MPTTHTPTPQKPTLSERDSTLVPEKRASRAASQQRAEQLGTGASFLWLGFILWSCELYVAAVPPFLLELMAGGEAAAPGRLALDLNLLSVAISLLSLFALVSHGLRRGSIDVTPATVSLCLINGSTLVMAAALNSRLALAHAPDPPTMCRVTAVLALSVLGSLGIVVHRAFIERREDDERARGGKPLRRGKRG
jgi:hypothetical protein